MTFMAIAIDIHAAIQDLQGVGIKPGCAEAIVKTVGRFSDNLATKSDLASTNRSRAWLPARRDAATAAETVTAAAATPTTEECCSCGRSCL